MNCLGIFTITPFGFTVCTTIIVCVAWYWFAYRPYQFFKRLGILHPPVIPFFGNAKQILQEGRLASYEKWIKKYGKVCGYYVGTVPHYLITDLDIVKEILMKHPDIFMDRVFEGQKVVDVIHSNQIGLITGKGEPWKRGRRIISPTYSVSKVKQMAPLVESCCNSLRDKFADLAKSGESIEVTRIFGHYTLSTLIASAFGRQLNTTTGEGEQIAKTLSFLLTSYTERTAVYMTEVIISNIPFLVTPLRFIAKRTKLARLAGNLVDTLLNLVKARRIQSMKSKDFLQTVIDGYDEEATNSPNGQTTLHDDEIVGQCLELMIAGYETTSNNLSFMAYLLATNPDKQEKLHQAIDEYYQENEDATLYEAAEAIEYLDWVCQEALRVYTAVPMFLRYCKKDVTIKGVPFYKGTTASIATQWIHMSPEYWDQPQSFRPERFSPEEKQGHTPACYMPFGMGPRHCVATKFAAMEIRMAMLAIMRTMKFVPAHNTKVPKTYAIVTQGPLNGIHLKISNR